MKQTNNLIDKFIKQEIETNSYYENIKAEYDKSDDKDYYIETIHEIFLDWYNGYFSIWAVMDTIEDKMEETGKIFQEVVLDEDFTIKDR